MSTGLYVHYPFCSHLCNYCDYFKCLHNKNDEARFFEGLNTETKLLAREFGHVEFASVFIGGGTPSLANLILFQEWMSVLRNHFIISEGVEFSIECNPETIVIETLQAFKEAGVNRLSLGVQTFNPQLLKSITRQHTPHQSHQALYFINTLDIRNYNVDLLFGLPGQTGDMLNHDVNQLIELSPPHLSLYQLTLEQNTPLGGDVAAGKVRLPDDDLRAAMFKSGCGKFVEAGYEQYEVSSFARPGHECKHNLNYWQGGEYIGLGPSAHSYLNGRCYANASDVSEYVRSLEKKELPRVKDEPWLIQRATETVASGLRLKCGIDRKQFAERFGLPLDERLNQREYDILIETGLLIDDNQTLSVSEEGTYMADEIAARLIK